MPSLRADAAEICWGLCCDGFEQALEFTRSQEEVWEVPASIGGAESMKPSWENGALLQDLLPNH